MRVAEIAASIACVVACSAPNRGDVYVRAFAAAEAAESAGRFADAAARYDEAGSGAKVVRDRDHARYLAARNLARSGNYADAAARLRAIALASPPLEDSAEAANAIADMEITHGDGESARSADRSTSADVGWSALLDVATRFPSDGVSRRALRRYVAHEDDAHGAQASLDELTRLTPSLDRTELGETVAYEIALHKAVLGDDAGARDAFLAVAAKWPYPHGAFWDDSLFRASVLDQKLGRIDAAIADLERMLAERESSFFTGTYERPRYEPAMVRLCALARDALHDRPRARACFDRLYTDFTTSELRDDALWEESRLSRDDGDTNGACAKLATLAHDFPDSRYVPCAAAECPSIARPSKSGSPTECHAYIARFRLGAADPEEPSKPEERGEPHK
jgi:tetratricopeptide (TPR) repeat protein